jgi:ribosomal protein S18 acetylase RimI-like enzyme
MELKDIFFRETTLEDKTWIDALIRKHWGDNYIAVHNDIYVPGELKGFTAINNDVKVGLITYVMKGGKVEIVSLNSEIEHIGVGAHLIDLVKNEAKIYKCSIMWLITTNDNINAIEFYKKRGFILTRINKGAVDLSRKLKPGIPLFGENGIPIQDELVFQVNI